MENLLKNNSINKMTEYPKSKVINLLNKKAPEEIVNHIMSFLITPEKDYKKTYNKSVNRLNNPYTFYSFKLRKIRKVKKILHINAGGVVITKEEKRRLYRNYCYEEDIDREKEN